MTNARMVPLTTVSDALTARILAAHLGAEGVVWQLRGNVDGPYPVGPVQVLVAEDDLELARGLLAVDVDPDAEPPPDAGADPAGGHALVEPLGDEPEPAPRDWPTGGHGSGRRVLAVLVAVACAAYAVSRFLILLL